MNKTAFLDALKRAMTGLPPEVQAKTLAWYEQRFVDGVAAGRTEEDVARELDDPKKIALTLRTSAHLDAFQQKRSPVNLLRFGVSAVGLAIFNLFMVVPAMVFGALLTALYVSALTFYLAGVAVSSSGLAGTNELVLAQPLRNVIIDDGDESGAQARVEIGPSGVQVYKDPAPAEPPASDSRVIRSAGKMATGSIHISTGLDDSSRVTQTLIGLGMVVGGIAMFLAALVTTRYSLIGLKRYVQMNVSLLKGS